MKKFLFPPPADFCEKIEMQAQRGISFLLLYLPAGLSFLISFFPFIPECLTVTFSERSCNFHSLPSFLMNKVMLSHRMERHLVDQSPPRIFTFAMIIVVFGWLNRVVIHCPWTKIFFLPVVGYNRWEVRKVCCAVRFAPSPPSTSQVDLGLCEAKPQWLEAVVTVFRVRAICGFSCAYLVFFLEALPIL